MAKIGVKIELEGAPQYKENMANLTAQTKLYQAQMKKLGEQLSNTSAFQKSITASKALSQQLEAQQNKSRLLEEQIAKTSAELGEDSTKVIRLKTQYENLQAEIAKTENELEKLGGISGAIGAEFEAIGNKLSEVGSKISSVGESLTTHITAPLAGIGAASVKTFADWESAFTGVMKTVDESATTTYGDIAEGIKKMATETASSKEEIAAVAEAAGQLGVGADDILKFTETMVQLGDSTNLSAEEAATALARISNITGDSLTDIDRLGSSIVALGNNFATNESSIVEMSNRLASAGSIAGLSTQDILALATAMSSVGIEAEAGGTAMTQTLTGISKAVSESGSKLETLAQVSGMTAEEFSSQWKSAPTEALQSFISGLSDMNAAGEDTYAILDELGMSGVRQSNMLQSLALASDNLASAVEVSNHAYEENSALTDEASKRYETFNAQLSQAKEELSNAGIQIGEILMPYVQQLVDKISELATWFQNLSPETQSMIVHIAALAAAIGPMLIAIGKIVTAVGSISSALGPVISFMPKIVTAVSTVGTVLTGTVIPAIVSFVAAFWPVIAVIAAVAAAIAGIILVIKNWGSIVDWISEKWTIFNAFISSIVSEIQSFFEEHMGIIGEIISARIEIIKTVIQTAVTIIKTVLTAMGQVLKALFKGDWDQIGKIVLSAFTSIQNTINSAKAKIILIIANLLSNITQKFTQLKNDALSWGRDFVQNFVDGITSKMNALLDHVRSMAETIRSYLHFSEPDVGPLKDFNQWPKDMVQQYADGIERYRYLVRDAVSDMATDISVLTNPFDSAEMYDAIRSGASDATIRLAIGDREFGRALRDMGVAFNG